LGADVQEDDFAGNSMSKVVHQSQLLPPSLPSGITDKESKMVASRNGLFDRGVNGVVVVPVEAACVLSKVDSLGDADFDSGPIGFAIQSGLVDVGAISRFME
jgi:hypothetical protein